MPPEYLPVGGAYSYDEEHLDEERECGADASIDLLLERITCGFMIQRLIKEMMPEYADATCKERKNHDSWRRPMDALLSPPKRLAMALRASDRLVHDGELKTAKPKQMLGEKDESIKRKNQDIEKYEV